jgi:hypothetical protein
MFDFSDRLSPSLQPLRRRHHVTGTSSPIVNHVNDLYEDIDFQAIHDNFNSSTPHLHRPGRPDVTRITSTPSPISTSPTECWRTSEPFKSPGRPFRPVRSLARGTSGPSPVVDFSAWIQAPTRPRSFARSRRRKAMTPPRQPHLAMQGAGLAAGDADKLRVQAQQSARRRAISDPAFR